MGARMRVALFLPEEAYRIVRKRTAEADHLRLQSNPLAETELAKGFSHAMLLTGTDRDKMTGRASFEADFEPRVVLEPPGDTSLKHVVLAKFKRDAPIASLVDSYAALPATILTIVGFEYAHVADAYFDVVFLSTFDDVAGRANFLEHELHLRLNERLRNHCADLLVVDFFMPATGNKSPRTPPTPRAAASDDDSYYSSLETKEEEAEKSSVV